MGYKYYDTPEGQDVFLKMWYTSKLAGITGLGVSTFDILFHSKPKGYYQTSARYAYYTLPFVGMAVAFTATTSVAQSIRKKDDKINYFLGGCAAGTVLGTWQKCKVTGFVGCVVLGTAALLKKMSVEEGWEFFPDATLHKVGSLRGVRHDWTLMPAPPKNWKVSESE